MAYMIIATFTYGSAEQRTKSVPIIKAHRERCLAHEPGTLKFEFSLANHDDTKVLFCEVYEDREAFEFHWDGTSAKQAFAEGEAQGINFTIESTHGTTVD